MKLNQFKLTIATTLLAAILTSQVWATQPHPASIKGLQAFAAQPSQLTVIRPLKELPGIEQKLAQFSVDKLNQFTLIQKPVGTPPPKGWPVLIYNHGFHPDPPRYGRRNSDGQTDRPGDYYRAIPKSYAQAGFLVLTPDYRGHNDSEGALFTGMPLSRNWYSRDVVALINALESIPEANTEKIFISGHSMGAAITANVIVALGQRITGATLWSGALLSFTENAALNNVEPSGDSGQAVDVAGALQRIHSGFAEETPPLTAKDAYFGNYLQNIQTPLNIHHATEDSAAVFNGSLRLALKLQQLGKIYHFYAYDGGDHLFKDDDLRLAIQRDIKFFRSLIDVKENSYPPDFPR